MSWDVFISHSSKDKSTAEATCAGLEAEGVRCWLAPRDVPPATDRTEAILEAIASCQAMVLIQTEDAGASEQVEREVSQAVKHGVAILPLSIEGLPPAESLKRHLDVLAATIRQILEGPGEPPDEPVEPASEDLEEDLEEEKSVSSLQLAPEHKFGGAAPSDTVVPEDLGGRIIPPPPTPTPTATGSDESPLSASTLVSRTEIEAEPTAPDDEPPPDDRHPARSKSWVVTLSVLILAVATGWILILKFLPSKDPVKAGNERTVKGTGTLKFPQLTVAGSHPPGALEIRDREGTTLAEIRVEPGQEALAQFPLELFEQSDRWPISIVLNADGHFMPPAPLGLAAFRDDRGSDKTYVAALDLKIQPYLEFEPVLSLNGAPLPDPGVVLKDYLTDTDGANLEVEVYDAKIRVLLPAAGSFPYETELWVPYTKKIPLVLGKDPPIWNLSFESKTLRVAGVRDIRRTSFKPDFSEIRPATRALLEAQLRPSLANLDLDNVPALDGELIIESPAGQATLLLAPRTKFKVVVGNRDSDPDENPAMEEARLQAEGELSNPDLIPAAQINIGTMYHTEWFKRAGAQDQSRWRDADKRGTLWLKLAAEEGKSAEAKVALGQVYLDRIGVPNDPKLEIQSFELFQQALALGDPRGEAENNLGICYNYGRGVAKNHALAKKHFQSASAKGNSEAMLNLGLLYFDKSNPKVDRAAGIKMFEQAAEAGNVEALYQLALSYRYGEGVPQNRTKAKEFYEQAKARGHAKAAAELSTF